MSNVDIDKIKILEEFLVQQTTLLHYIRQSVSDNQLKILIDFQFTTMSKIATTNNMSEYTATAVLDDQLLSMNHVLYDEMKQSFKNSI